MSWKSGTLTGNTLSFPAAGQTWPPLTGLYLGASSTTTPRDITGTIDADGRVDLTMQYDVLLKSGVSECTLTGSVALSSQGSEKLGGASGSNYNPATGAFSVVSTSYNQPAESGQCLLANAAYDLSQGMGWYLTGTLQLPGAPVAQTATVKVPKTIKAKGKTVLLKKAVVTNAGQTATAKVSWSTKTKGPEEEVRLGEDQQDGQGHDHHHRQGQAVEGEADADGPGGAGLPALLLCQEVDGQVGPGAPQPPLLPRRAARGTGGRRVLPAAVGRAGRSERRDGEGLGDRGACTAGRHPAAAGRSCSGSGSRTSRLPGPPTRWTCGGCGRPWG